MKKLFEPWQIKTVKIKNRICFPPVVCYAWGTEDGYVTQENVEHYRKVAKGQTGLIIQEATCVDRNGKLAANQLGIWEDGQIKGLSEIADAVHKEGCPIFIQIHHAGVSGLDGELACPSDYSFYKDGVKKAGKEMTIEEIHKVQQEFTDAAVRAWKAGYDGVELHGCHQYLMCEFFNRWVNRRQDAYGEHRERFAVEILRAIKEKVPEDFVVGIRLGGFEPRLEDGVRHARVLEKEGIDFIDVSYGFSGEDDPKAPADFPYEKCIYAAAQIKRAVSVPVFAVNGITDPEMAQDILERTDVDMIDIARGIIVNHNWARDAMEGRDTGKCLHCRRCLWCENPDTCTGRKILEKNLQRKKEFIDNL